MKTNLNSEMFVISNFNQDPNEILRKIGQRPYVIYDQSDELHRSMYGIIETPQIKFRDNCGHSLSNMFEFIVENW